MPSSGRRVRRNMNRRHSSGTRSVGVWRLLEATGNAIFDVADAVAHPQAVLASINASLPRVRIQIGGKKRKLPTADASSQQGSQAPSTGVAVSWLRRVRRRFGHQIKAFGLPRVARIVAGSKVTASETGSKKKILSKHGRAPNQRQPQPQQTAIDWTAVALPPPITTSEDPSTTQPSRENDQQPLYSAGRSVQSLESELAILRAQIEAVMAGQSAAPRASAGASGTSSFSTANPQPQHFNTMSASAIAGKAPPAPPPAPPVEFGGPSNSKRHPTPRRSVLRDINTNSPTMSPTNFGKKETSANTTADSNSRIAALSMFGGFDEEDDAVVSFRGDSEAADAAATGFSLADVASGAARGALKKIGNERSPGGTPLRKNSRRVMSPSQAVSTQDMIALALHKKFASVRASEVSPDHSFKRKGVANVRQGSSPLSFNVHDEDTWDDCDLW